jgi:uncharacterized protein (DUF433 family)
MRLDQVVHSDPDILGGTPAFVGTRVPVRSLFDDIDGFVKASDRDYQSVRDAMELMALGRPK